MTFENSENSTIFERINIMRGRTRRAKCIFYLIVLLWYEPNLQIIRSQDPQKSTKSKGLLKRRWRKLISHFSTLLVFWGFNLRTCVSQILYWLVDAGFKKCVLRKIMFPFYFTNFASKTTIFKTKLKHVKKGLFMTCENCVDRQSSSLEIICRTQCPPCRSLVMKTPFA